MKTTHLPTLRKIAEAAGVSVGTVSAALNDRPTVSPTTRAHVLDVAGVLGYKIKRRKQIQDDVQLGVVGLLIKHTMGTEWETDPFYSRIQLGVTNTCQHHNINLMVAKFEVDGSNRPISWPTMVNEQRIDGLLLAGAFIDDSVHMFKRKTNIPIVLIDGYAPNYEYDNIVTDNRGGAIKAVRYLVEQGHTRIGLVGWNEISPPSIQQRQQGYLDALAAHGLEPCIAQSELSHAGGHAAAYALLEAKPPVTAIFACNDNTAIGVMNALRHAGVHVPHNISVIGFDNTDLASATTPALSTIHVHKSWMGTLGVQALIERARNPGRPHTTTVLSTEVVVRETVSRLR